MASKSLKVPAVDVGGVFGGVGTDPNVALCGKVVDLVGLNLRTMIVGAVDQVSVVQGEAHVVLMGSWYKWSMRSVLSCEPVA